MENNENSIVHHLLSEKRRIGRLSQIRELIFGAQDGLLTSIIIISTVAGAFADSRVVLITGVAQGLAGAISMGTGAFLASEAERQVRHAEVVKERAAARHSPEEEKEEMLLLFEHEGVPKHNAMTIVENLMTSEKAFFNTMVQKEFGIDPAPPTTALNDSFVVGISYLIASFVPLLPYFFLSIKSAFFYSILFTVFALFGLGALKAKFANLHYIKSGLQILAIGTLSGLGGYLLGTVLPKLLGIN
jgi:VIT1/CCC1 family predicted Fe2+/Mn2+ transporter